MTSDSVLVTATTGYVGGRLIPVLEMSDRLNLYRLKIASGKK